jgi:hypothetical protein
MLDEVERHGQLLAASSTASPDARVGHASNRHEASYTRARTNGSLFTSALVAAI